MVGYLASALLTNTFGIFVILPKSNFYIKTQWASLFDKGLDYFKIYLFGRVHWLLAKLDHLIKQKIVQCSKLFTASWSTCNTFQDTLALPTSHPSTFSTTFLWIFLVAQMGSIIYNLKTFSLVDSVAFIPRVGISDDLEKNDDLMMPNLVIMTWRLGVIKP